MAREHWHFHIEAYRWIGTEGYFTPVGEQEANTWFVVGDKGEERRFFGMFSSRFGAEDAIEKIELRELGKDFKAALKEAARSAGNERDKQNER